MCLYVVYVLHLVLLVDVFFFVFCVFKFVLYCRLLFFVLNVFFNAF